MIKIGNEKKVILFDGAEVRGTILYCPDCGHRIAYRQDKLFGAIETFLVVYGKCRCLVASEEWSFRFVLPIKKDD